MLFPSTGHNKNDAIIQCAISVFYLLLLFLTLLGKQAERRRSSKTQEWRSLCGRGRWRQRPCERLTRNVIRLTDRLANWLAVRQIRKRRMRWQQALATACALCFHSSMPLRYSSLVGPRSAGSFSAAVVMLPQHSGLGARAFRARVSSSLFPASWWRVLLGTLDRNCKQKNG